MQFLRGLTHVLLKDRMDRRMQRLSAEEQICIPRFRRVKRNKDALAKLQDEVRTLILGSSHALWGYVAGDSEFNLAEVSCDFRLCSELLQYWLPRLSIGRVLLFFDPFSPGNVLVKSPDCYRLIPYCALYGFKYPEIAQRTLCGEMRGLDLMESCRRYVVHGNEDAPSGWRGNLEPEDYGTTGLCEGFGREQLEARVRSHLKLSHGDECRHLKVMRDVLAKRQKELVLIVPPARRDYVQLFRQGHPEPVLPPSFMGCRVLNFMEDSSFCDEDFVDCDHLNQTGARKLSRAVGDALRISHRQATGG